MYGFSNWVGIQTGQAFNVCGCSNWAGVHTVQVFILGGVFIQGRCSYQVGVHIGRAFNHGQTFAGQSPVIRLNLLGQKIVIWLGRR